MIILLLLLCVKFGKVVEPMYVSDVANYNSTLYLALYNQGFLRLIDATYRNLNEKWIEILLIYMRMVGLWLFYTRKCITSKSLSFSCCKKLIHTYITNFYFVCRPHSAGDGLIVLSNSQPAMWVKIASSWVCILIYVWTLLAPIILSGREFD